MKRQSEDTPSCSSKRRFDPKRWKAELDRRSEGGGHTLVLPVDPDEPTRAIPVPARPAPANRMSLCPENQNRPDFDQALRARFESEGRNTLRIPPEDEPVPSCRPLVEFDDEASDFRAVQGPHEDPTVAIPFLATRSTSQSAEEPDPEDTKTVRIQLDPWLLEDSEAVTREIPKRPPPRRRR